MFPENLEYIGPELWPGCPPPTRGLVEAVLDQSNKGIAPPSAEHLYVAAHPVTERVLRSEYVRQGVEMLRSYCEPNNPLSLSAVGMAYPQLAQASAGSFRVLAVKVGMPSAKLEHRDGAETRIFYNPTITPIESEGWQYRYESCFSAPGIAVVVKRWNAIMVQEWGGEPERLDGNDAWFAQHEGDHLDGIIGAMRACEEGSKLYYFSPEALPAARSFFEDLSAGPPQGNWPEVPVELWLAMKEGRVDLRDYALFL